MEFKIGEKIQKPEIRKNVFCLKTRVMHGDGDLYLDRKHYINSDIDLKEYIRRIELVKTFNHDYYNTEDTLAPVIDFAFDDWTDFVSWDSTTDGQTICKVDSYSATYFNFQGDEYKVIL